MQEATDKDWPWTAILSEPTGALFKTPPSAGGYGQGSPSMHQQNPTNELVIPDWLHALMLGMLQADADAAPDPGCLQGWGLAGCPLGPYLLPPSGL